MADARVTQDVVEVLSEPTPAVRVTQDVVEVLNTGPVTPRVSQDVVEVLSTVPVTPRVSQYVVEVLTPYVRTGIEERGTVSAAPGSGGGTTAAWDTTGADLLVWSVGWYEGGGTLSISDSKGNTWLPLTKRGPSQFATHRFWYAKNPIVGPGHTFTASGAGTYAAQIVYAFAGADLTAPFDVESGSAAHTGSPQASGSVTPSRDGSVIVSAYVCLTNPGNSTEAVTPPMSLTAVGDASVGREVCGLTLQQVAAPVNPTWSWAGSSGTAVATAVFKPAGAAGGSSLSINVAETITVADDVTKSSSGPPIRVNRTAASVWTTATATTLAAPALSVTAGNTLVVAVGAVCAGGVSVTGITDSAGNTYVKADHVLGEDNYREDIWYAKNITGHASNVVTVTWSAAVPYRGIVVIQYAGLDPVNPLEGTAKGTAPAGNQHVVTGVLTTARANTVHVLIPRWGLYTVDTITWPPGFSANFSTDPNTQISEKFVAATFADNCLISHTNAANAKIALVAAFTATAVVPGINVAETISVSDVLNDAPVVVARGVGGTTAPITTTGAGLLVIAAAWWNGSGAPSFSDSKGNTWTPLTSYGTNARVRFFYCASPVVGGSHTFFGTTGAFVVLAFAGTYTAGAQNGLGLTGFPASPQFAGSITPASSNALILTALSATDPGDTYRVSTPAGFTVTSMIGGASAMDDAVGYMRQTAATAVNPRWMWSGTHGQLSLAVVAFLPTAAPVLTIDVAETITVTESATRGIPAIQLLQAESETIGISEFVTVQLSLGVAPAEALTITEQVAFSVWTMRRASAFESLTVTEGLTRVSHDAAVATGVEAVTITEEVQTQLSLTAAINVFETIGVADALVKAYTTPLVVRAAEAVGLQDVSSMPIGAPLVYETIRVSDVVLVGSPVLIVQVHETITITEPYMNHGTVGLGPNPTPLPGGTLPDFWVVGIT